MSIINSIKNLFSQPEKVPATRRYARSVSDPSQVIKTKVSKILKGNVNKPIRVEMPNGLVTAICHRGERVYNQDVQVIDPSNNLIASIDGMGGGYGGEIASGILGETILAGSHQKIVFGAINEYASQAMAESMPPEKAQNEEMGAVYVIARIRSRVLRVYSCGDSRLIVARKGRIIFSTEEERTEGGVANCVTSKFVGTMRHYPAIEMKNGDRIIAASDGLWDNILSEQVQSAILNEAPRRVISVLNGVALHTMRFHQRGNPDNINIIVYDINNV